jgi:hypothetical protein
MDEISYLAFRLCTFVPGSVFTERLIKRNHQQRQRLDYCGTKSHSKNIVSLRTESKLSDNREELAELGVIFLR